jgi:uncharacterized protein (DUF952 family)
MNTPNIIYKICTRDEWESAKQLGQFTGSAADAADGFIHFSTAAQMRETAAKHFAGQSDLVLIAIDADQLGESLKWEPSRGDELFPHLYAALPTTSAISVSPLPIGKDGIHRFPSPDE